VRRGAGGRRRDDEAQLAAAEAERQRLAGIIADLEEEMAALKSELAATIKELELEREAHAAEKALRMRREQELSQARRRIEQLLETIREKDAALRQLTVEAKRAVIKATDFLADAVRKQQEELQGQMVTRLVAVGAEVDAAAGTVFRPTTPDGLLMERDDPRYSASLQAQLIPEGVEGMDLADQPMSSAEAVEAGFTAPEGEGEDEDEDEDEEEFQDLEPEPEPEQASIEESVPPPPGPEDSQEGQGDTQE